MDGFLNAVSFFAMIGFVEISAHFIDGLIHGYHFPKWWPFKFKRIKPIFTTFKLPIIVIKIATGIIYQYMFPFLYQHYNLKWTQKTRTLILSIILLRAGLELDLKGKSLQCLICGFIPVISEIFMNSLIGYYGMGLRYSFAVAQSYVIGAGSPGIVIPILLNFKMRGMGVKKGIVNIMMAAITIDEITSIIGLGAAQTFAFNEVISPQASTADIVLHLIYEILAAIGVGIAGGLLMYPLKDANNKIKVIPLLTFSIGIIFAFEQANFYESKYLASLIFGYVTNKIWHEKAPEHELNEVWKICSPALFGSIGADLDVSKINPDALGFTFAIILTGITTKFLVMLALGFLLFRKVWKNGEIVFAASCCLAKAAFQASLGSSFVTMANSLNKPEFLPMGYNVVTMAILTIIVAGPLGSITSILLGNKYLEFDQDAPQVKRIPGVQSFIEMHRMSHIFNEKNIPRTYSERREIIVGRKETKEVRTENDLSMVHSESSSGTEKEVTNFPIKQEKGPQTEVLKPQSQVDNTKEPELKITGQDEMNFDKEEAEFVKRKEPLPDSISDYESSSDMDEEIELNLSSTERRQKTTNEINLN